jgi:hypothetical protein
MLSNDLYTNIIYPTIVVLGTTLLIFICSFLYKKIKKRRKDKKPDKNRKNHLFVEIKGKARYYIEIDTTNSYLMQSMIIVNNGNETVFIRNIQIQMGHCIGKTMDEKKIIICYHSDKRANYIIGNKINFPFALTPNTPKDISLSFIFTDPSIEIGKYDLKINTSEGEIIIPVLEDIIR